MFGSSWSYVLAGTLAFAWFFYVTSKGELPEYLGVLGLTSNTPASTPAANASTSTSATGSPSNPLSASNLGIF